MDSSSTAPSVPELPADTFKEDETGVKHHRRHHRKDKRKKGNKHNKDNEGNEKKRHRKHQDVVTLESLSQSSTTVTHNSALFLWKHLFS